MTIKEKTAHKYFPCTCSEIYLSRKLTAPNCPYHAFDWESAMDEYAGYLISNRTYTESITEIPKEILNRYAKEMITKFGEWNLMQELRYDRGDNPEYGKWNYYKKVEKFFEWLNDK